MATRFEAAITSGQRPGDPQCQVSWAWPSGGEAWMREVVSPNLLLFLEAPQREALRQRLSPQGMAEQFRKNERVAGTPGLAGSAMAPMLEDPLGLHELVAESYARVSDAGAGRPGRPMLSPDGRSLLIQVTPTDPTHDSDEANAVVDSVQRAIEQAKPGELEVSVGGGLAIASAAQRSIRGDMIASSIGTVILLQVLFLAFYRRLVLFPIAFLPALVGVLVGFGCFALTGRTLSPPTAVLGALLAGLGIDYAIHYLAHAGDGDALPLVSRKLSGPLSIACVTSVIAFLTLIASDVAALRDFATIGAIGLVATLAASLFFLPALLTLLSRRSPDRPNTIAEPRWRTAELIHATVRRRRMSMAVLLTAAGLAGLVLALYPGGPIAYDSELGNMHPQHNAPLQAQRDIARAFPAHGETLLIYITAPTEQALVQRADQCSKRLKTDPRTSSIVAGKLGIDTLIPSPEEQAERRAFAQSIDVQRVQADFDQAVDQSIFNPAAFASYREALGRLLRPGEGPTLAQLRDYPDLTAGLLPRATDSVDASADRYQAVSLVSLRSIPQTRAARGDVIDAVRGALGDEPGVTLTGLTVVGHDIETQVRRELPLLLAIAGAAVVVWLGLCYRGPRDLVLALLPVTLGLLVTFAMMRLAGIGLNLLNLVALPLLIGLGVDDGVFLVSIARDCRRRGADRTELIHHLASSAQAVTLTSATTALAFGSLVLTAVPAIRGLGIVMAGGIVACWAITVGLLAPLIAGPAGHTPSQADAEAEL